MEAKKLVERESKSNVENMFKLIDRDTLKNSPRFTCGRGGGGGATLEVDGTSRKGARATDVQLVLWVRGLVLERFLAAWPASLCRFLGGCVFFKGDLQGDGDAAAAATIASLFGPPCFVLGPLRRRDPRPEVSFNSTLEMGKTLALPFRAESHLAVMVPSPAIQSVESFAGQRRPSSIQIVWPFLATTAIGESAGFDSSVRGGGGGSVNLALFCRWPPALLGSIGPLRFPPAATVAVVSSFWSSSASFRLPEPFASRWSTEEIVIVLGKADVSVLVMRADRVRPFIGAGFTSKEFFWGTRP